MQTLYGLITGLVGGVLGAFAIDFIRNPFRQFFTLRTEIRQQMLRLANVPPPDPSWVVPRISEEQLERLLRPIREAESTLRDLGTRMIALAETEWMAVRCVRLLGFEPLQAGHSLIGLSNTIRSYGKERTDHRASVNKALRLPD